MAFFWAFLGADRYSRSKYQNDGFKAREFWFSIFNEGWKQLQIFTKMVSVFPNFEQPLLSHGNHHRRVFTHRTPFAEFSLRLTCCKTVEVDLDQKISEVLDSLTGPLLKMEGNSSLHIQRLIWKGITSISTSFSFG